MLHNLKVRTGLKKCITNYKSKKDTNYSRSHCCTFAVFCKLVTWSLLITECLNFPDCCYTDSGHVDVEAESHSQYFLSGRVDSLN